MPDTDVLAAVDGVLNKEGTLEDIKQAVANGGDVDSERGNATPLIGAVQECRADIVQCLLECRADPDKPDPKGVGPLHKAIFDGVYEVAQSLIDAKADVNKQDRHGQTPLFFAPHRKACAQLGAANADVNAVNAKGQSALHLAAHAGLNDAVLWLVENMDVATINVQDRHGRTAVYCAAHSNLKSTILLLQEHGADVSLRPHKYSLQKEKSRQRIEDAKEKEAEAQGETVRREWVDGDKPEAPTEAPKTELTEPVVAGSTVLPVADTVGFAVGDPIYIESEAGAETNAIKGFGSIQLAYPLQFSHPPGTKIGKLPPDDPRVNANPEGEALTHDTSVAEEFPSYYAANVRPSSEFLTSPFLTTLHSQLTTRPTGAPAAALPPPVQATIKSATGVKTPAKPAPAAPGYPPNEGTKNAASAPPAALPPPIAAAAPDAAAPATAPAPPANEGTKAEAAAPPAALPPPAALAAPDVAAPAALAAPDAAAPATAPAATDVAPPTDPASPASGAADEAVVTAPVVATAEAAVRIEAAKEQADDEEYWKKKEEEGAVMIQTVFRGKKTRARVEKKAAAQPIPKTDWNGATVWDVVLTKDPRSNNKQKYGFSHSNAKTDFAKEYIKSFGSAENSNASVALPPGPQALVVKKVGEKGLLEEWNFVHEDAQVGTGDRIFQVNDKTSIEEMQKELRQASVTLKVMHYPPSFTTMIEKRPGARKLGFKFEKPQNTSLKELKITEVTKDGLLDEVNRIRMAEGHHHLVVLAGMRIEAANDVSGDGGKIAEELRKCEKATLKIRRAAGQAQAKMKVQQQMKLLSAFGFKKFSAPAVTPTSPTSP